MINEYQEMINHGLNTVDELVLKRIRNSLQICAERRNPVLTIGNGGSAAIADHWSCDHTKGVRQDVDIFPDVRCLANDMSIITAIANDISYDHIFSKQIEWCSAPYALVLAVSSSGNSPNIINGLKAAREKEYGTVAFVGFSGGEILRDRLADYIIHVDVNNYGVVEDCHQILMHILAQDIRKKLTKKNISDLSL